MGRAIALGSKFEPRYNSINIDSLSRGVALSKKNLFKSIYLSSKSWRVEGVILISSTKVSLDGLLTLLTRERNTEY